MTKTIQTPTLLAEIDTRTDLKIKHQKPDLLENNWSEVYRYINVLRKQILKTRNKDHKY